ncbi:hypothetical protein [Vagococcus zengguangii]|uniref:hypothetical protein n=1 Tax=Vagococcus zengguangii TaxID=2571750 RepID=UPI0011094288|nr:hypothetical protein [Vagococcus zengguangii]TLG80216.1 hypothetical protein FE258_05885 [Vagococcus zengguangii]
MKESTDRKYFRFPAFSDKEGVKLSTQPKRKIFEDHEPVIITKYQTATSNKIEELRHLDEIDQLNEFNKLEEMPMEPTKEKNWEPKPTKKEKLVKGLAIKDTSPIPKQKKNIATFTASYQPPIAKRVTEEVKSWLPEEVENRIDKHAALEEKLAKTRFAEEKDKFVPKPIPQQMYGEDPSVIEAQEKIELAKQLAAEKENYLVLASEADNELPELTEVATNISLEMEASTTEEAYNIEEVTLPRNKRTVPQAVKKDLITQPKISSFSTKKDVETPVFKKKNGQEEKTRTRLDKSLAGIISDEGKLTNSRYFELDD